MTNTTTSRNNTLTFKIQSEGTIYNIKNRKNFCTDYNLCYSTLQKRIKRLEALGQEPRLELEFTQGNKPFTLIIIKTTRVQALNDYNSFKNKLQND